MFNYRTRRVRWSAAASAALLLALALVACSQVQRARDSLAHPRSYDEVTALVETVRTFEASIGFQATKNFRRFSDERPSYPFCGYAPQFYLPYSYEDPAIKWYNVATEEECRTLEQGGDVYFGHSEAVGESETPITPAMLKAPVSRLIYLVMHENCHDQFELPYGIEEPLCNVIAYHALPLFAREQYGLLRAEYYAVGAYADDGSNFARAAIRFYDEIGAVYSQREKLASNPRAVLRDRARIFKRAARALGTEEGVMNNVVLANAMTYSRHYPFLEQTFQKLHGDIGRTVAFFRTVDAARPRPAEILKQHGLTTTESVEYLRAYETSVIETAKRLLIAQACC